MTKPDGWKAEGVYRSKRFDPVPVMRSAEWCLEEVRRGLSSGHFSPAVRAAEHLAALIRVAAIAEERDLRDNPSSLFVLPPPPDFHP